MASSMSRTLKALREMGCKCEVVEHWNPYVKPHGIRQDLFNIIDIIALDKKLGVVGVQVCGSDFAEHIKKMTVDNRQDSIDWLQTPGTVLELWGWCKLKKKRGGKQMVWRPRIRRITLEDLK